ncbi:hypothetical protein SAMN04487917_101375 [Arthrobacter sp. yr096]|uniref:hypothetical protein n=1 Tax=Arthrobacter sp. yr096 TaxID=1761750 RepID=UPI0008AF00D8|nr:hypothetical protein [Arthrobacter sp. yr096]SEI45357.1 hypothetical protein SAMN04487917_101375 [Arthrobacter sp. yr096]
MSAVYEDGVCYCQWCLHGGENGDYIDVDVIEDGRQKLSDWHDTAHGLTLWANCPHEPCKLLSDDFRRTP